MLSLAFQASQTLIRGFVPGKAGALEVLEPHLVLALLETPMRAGQVLDLSDAHDRLVVQVLHAQVDVVGALAQTVVDKVETQLAALFI